uniref:Uncharacterized protein n=1 Tax=Vespula pensylvanica TaxID=30213 RepID=A0A834P2A6_VESPE|nr:hypothetical protein H0235_007961 [Vespula pensylvanica]
MIEQRDIVVVVVIDSSSSSSSSNSSSSSSNMIVDNSNTVRSGRGFHGSPLTSETREDASSSASSLCFAVWEKEEEKEEDEEEGEKDEEKEVEKEEIVGARRGSGSRASPKAGPQERLEIRRSKRPPHFFARLIYQ